MTRVTPWTPPPPGVSGPCRGLGTEGDLVVSVDWSFILEKEPDVLAPVVRGHRGTVLPGRY